ncbi:hypothetical protein ACFV8E_32575 [Streptomyces sp. NPDC059849]|uniref:pPIWI_RE_Z domain-containing protein n=1 Tax=Streptomyces sp. NPDC059849 TaxID=3346969 RepID=UPI00366965C2
MTREVNSWSNELTEEAKAAGLEALMAPLSAREFFRLELGLFFLTQHMPGQPVTDLRHVLDGYLPPAAGTESSIRWLRHRMGKSARTGQWRVRLNEYCKVPAYLRLFELIDPGAQRVVSSSVFRRRGSDHLPGREKEYRAALATPVEYEPVTLHEPAPVGVDLLFRRADGSRVKVRFPDWVKPAEEEVLLHPRARRTRVPFSVTVEDMTQAAKEMDLQLQDSPRHRADDFAGRLESTVFARVDEKSATVTDGLGVFSIDGVAHVVGLMNSGKTTFNDIVVKVAVGRGLRVGYLVASVGDALAKVRFFRSLGIRAVPLIGGSGFADHVDRYWDDRLYNPDACGGVPDEEDAAAEFATDVCLVEQLLPTAASGAEELAAKERPCRDRFRAAQSRGKRARLFNCPLLSVCPAKAATRQVPDAQVWVTTSAAFLLSKAEPAAYSARWIIAAQHELDLLVGDEADRLMADFDRKFIHHEPLTVPGGWSSRSAMAWQSSLSGSWYAPLSHKDGNAYHRFMLHHDEALGGLYPLLTPPKQDHEADACGPDSLTEMAREGPFSGFTLLMRLARLLHGIEARSEKPEQAAQWEAAEQFFEKFFGDVARDPFQAPPTHLASLINTMTAGYQAPLTVEEAAEAWLCAHAPKEPALLWEQTQTRMGELVRLLVAACWTSRVTTSFFQLSARQESVRALMPLEETGSILKHQPPPELQTLVPELPMGNMMMLQWKPNRDGSSGSLEVLWLRGVGRWLLYHLHDLLACEGVEGPHVLLSSATSYLPASARYFINIRPSLILRERPECAEALKASRMHFRPQRRPAYERGIFVSGARDREARTAAIRAISEAAATPAPGASMSLLDQVLSQLDPDRRQVAFVTLSAYDAKMSAYYLNTQTSVRARHVVNDSAPPGRYGLAYRRISHFPHTNATVLAAPEGSLGRGHNLLNERKVAALGAIFYLARLHPPPDDLSFPLAVLNSHAMERLLRPAHYGAADDDPSTYVRRLVHGSRAIWLATMGQPMHFRTLKQPYLRRAFIADLLISLYQTTGRGIRGNVPIHIYLLDAAFAPRAANPRERALDTDRTSVLVAGRNLMRELLADPGPNATSLQRLDHVINKTVWGLLDNLFETMDWG